MHHLTTIELVDEVGGTWFDVWVPKGARHRRVSMHEIVAQRDAIEMSIALAQNIALEHEASLWRRGGALVLRTQQLADGHLVSVLGDRCLDVIRHVRHPRGSVRVHVRIAGSWRVGWQVQSIAEGLAVSLHVH